MGAWSQPIGLQLRGLLPALVFRGFRACYVAGKFPWRVKFETLVGLAAESVLFARLLLLLDQG